jgi:hypothetical protein
MDFTKAGWMLDKRINLGNIFTASMIATSILWWAAQIEKRIAIVEVELNAFYEVQAESKSMLMIRDDLQESEIKLLETMMKKEFEYLHTKLDKLK